MTAEPFTELPHIVDAYCCLGRFKQPVSSTFYGHDAASLLDEMDQKGVGDAIVHHSIARLSHPIDGNEETMRMVEGQPRLRACWSVLSKASREYESFEGYVEAAIQRGVRCFAVFPRFGANPPGNDTSVREFVRAETFRILEDRRLPIFIDFGANPAGGIDDTDWEALRFLLAAHPKLPVILCEFRMRGGSRLVPGVMDDHPNLHLETSGLWNYMSLEHIARNWGAERLIFGSRSPWHSVGLAIGMVTMANLPAAQRAMILGGNIRRLMEAAR
jgi:predicted TIM-barrel fold metal-dependent hydrolase